MDDFGDMLSSVLSDPSSMEKIRSIADSLGLSQGEPAASAPQNAPPLPPPSFSAGDGMMEKIMPLLAAYSRADSDRNVQLLKALKPYFSDGKSEILDQAVLVMKILAVLGGEGKDKH